MKYCTFAGHREVYCNGLENRITDEIARIIESDSNISFFNGGMGKFDLMCVGAVRSAKE